MEVERELGTSLDSIRRGSTSVASKPSLLPRFLYELHRKVNLKLIKQRFEEIGATLAGGPADGMLQLATPITFETLALRHEMTLGFSASDILLFLATVFLNYDASKDVETASAVRRRIRSKTAEAATFTEESSTVFLHAIGRGECLADAETDTYPEKVIKSDIVTYVVCLVNVLKLVSLELGPSHDVRSLWTALRSHVHRLIDDGDVWESNATLFGWLSNVFDTYHGKPPCDKETQMRRLKRYLRAKAGSCTIGHKCV